LHLVSVLNPKITTFSPLVPVQRPQEIDEKNSKKVFFGPKNFLKNFGAAFGTWYYLRKKIKKGSTRYQIRGLPVILGKIKKVLNTQAFFGRM
jgi:hypothetical protein